MKPSIYALGKTKSALSSVFLSVKGDKAQWCSRLIVLEGPKPLELASFNEGSFPVEVWELLLAGSMSLTEAIGHDFPNAWRESPVTDWLPVTNDGASYGKAFKALKHLVSTDSPRNYGTMIQCEGNRICATDGFRLSYFELPTLTPMGFPAFGLPLALKLLKGSSSIQVSQDGSMIRLCAGHWTAYFRAPAVKFPNYQSVLPANTKPLALEAAKAAIEQSEPKAKIYSKEPAKHTKANFTEVRTEEGPIYFNPCFFRELKGFDSFSFTDSKGPLKATKGNQTYIVVPVKLPEPKQSASA